MTEVKSKKPLLEAIQNGEQNIKVTDPKFLLACLVAEECDNDKSNVKKFLNVILGSKNVIDTQDRPQIKVGLVNEKGKVWWLFINLSICSTALGIIDILNDTYAKIKVEKDERGNLTGNVEIVEMDVLAFRIVNLHVAFFYTHLQLLKTVNPLLFLQ